MTDKKNVYYLFKVENTSNPYIRKMKLINERAGESTAFWHTYRLYEHDGHNWQPANTIYYSGLDDGMLGCFYNTFVEAKAEAMERLWCEIAVTEKRLKDLTARYDRLAETPLWEDKS